MCSDMNINMLVPTEQSKELTNVFAEFDMANAGIILTKQMQH